MILLMMVIVWVVVQSYIVLEKLQMRMRIQLLPLLGNAEVATTILMAPGAAAAFAVTPASSPSFLLSSTLFFSSNRLPSRAFDSAIKRDKMGDGGCRYYVTRREQQSDDMCDELMIIIAQYDMVRITHHSSVIVACRHCHPKTIFKI